MWKLLYQLASPKYFYTMTRSWMSVFSMLSLSFLAMGFFWGLVIAPPDYQQGDAFRIIYIHVPAAFLSMGLYAFMGFLSVLLLVWRIKLAGLLLPITAKVGASMAVIALISGSLWGKPMWGAWWVWDARLTSELILLMLYAAILAIHSALVNVEQADSVSAIFTLIGLVDLPIIHYSVYWWNTLHQGATLSALEKPHISPSMLYPLLMTLAGLALFCGWVILYRARHEVLLRARHQQWVRQTVMEDCR